jgi:antitoxin MazE
MRVQIKQWGNSASIRVPSAVMSALQMAIDDELELESRDGCIVLKPLARRKFDLASMVEAIKPSNLHGEVSSGVAVGEEML